MKTYPKINYAFRPKSYWADVNPLAAILRNVTWENRRKMIRDYWAAGKLAELDPALLADEIAPATGHDLGPRADFGAILAIHRFQLALRLGGRRKPASTTSQRRSRGIRYGEMSPTPLLLRLGAYQSEQMNDLWHLDFHHGKIRLPRPACQSRSRRPSDWMAEAISGNREFFAPVSSFM